MTTSTTMITRTEHLSPLNRMRIPRVPIQSLLDRCLAAQQRLNTPAASRPEEVTAPATNAAQSTNISNSY